MEDLIVGYSGKRFAIDQFDLTNGVELRSTYAHLMAPFMIALKPAPPGEHHPGPWIAAQGGLGFDILAELYIPFSIRETLGHDPSIIAWIITALIRLKSGSGLRAPVASNISFRKAASERLQAQFRAVEIEPQVISLDDSIESVDQGTLEWIRDNWIEAMILFVDNSEFRLLFNAFDETQFSRNAELALIQLWSALEALFSPARVELRYRVSTNIASYLFDPSTERMLFQKEILKLYDARSAAAHGRDADTWNPLIDTYSLVKQIIEKIICDRHVPTPEEIVARVFGADMDEPAA
jgi:hypothetical protein